MAAKNKGGQPRKIKTPDELLKLFKKYSRTKKGLLTVQGFALFLINNTAVSHMDYWYEMNDEFKPVKKIIEAIMFDRYCEMGYDKDNATAFLIFYGKNKFGLTDKVQSDLQTEIDNENLRALKLKNDLSEKLLNNVDENDNLDSYTDAELLEMLK